MGVVIRPYDDNDDAIPIARVNVDIDDNVADSFNDTDHREDAVAIIIQFVRHIF